MDLDYALRMAFTVKRGPEDREEIQLADGTIQETAGRVDTYWKFKNDELVPITFEVLENCCSDVVVGEEFLSDHEVFHKQLSSLVDTRWNINFYELAPFDFVRKWQRPFQELSQTLSKSIVSIPLLSRPPKSINLNSSRCHEPTTVKVLEIAQSV